MKLKKKEYESPDMVVSHVEVESPICGASADIANPESKDYGMIESQQVNTGFNSGYSSETWGNTQSTNTVGSESNGWTRIQ